MNRSSVHPRLRGELLTIINSKLTLSGSSPLARGTLLKLRLISHQIRFIPACAGNSIWRTLSPGNQLVHPRLRGELFILRTNSSISSGSSPLARGTRQNFESNYPLYRFIPACAGNSHRSLYPYHHNPVHPRLRGELARSRRRSLV